MEYSLNPKLPLSEPVQGAFSAMRARRLEALTRQQRLAVESRPTKEEMQRLHALDGVDHSAGIDIIRRYRDRVLPIRWTHDGEQLSPLDDAPLAGSADFWWAQTHWFAGGGIGQSMETDGLHCFGHVSYNRDPLFPFGVGAWATFELQPERRPPSASGRYNSFPYVELFGKVVGWTNVKHCPWACDDKWSKCFLFLRQSAIQFVDDVGTWRLCGETTSLRTLINEEGAGRTVEAALPGFLPMPPLQFGLLRPDRSVLIDLEVRFDVQLEGDSYIGFSPADNPAGSVLLRYFQWPCVAA